MVRVRSVTAANSPTVVLNRNLAKHQFAISNEARFHHIA
jgi:hypothetical protein